MSRDLQHRVAVVSAVRCSRGGAEWLAASLQHRRLEPASALGNAVADILGEVYYGIYHLDKTALFHKRTKWHDPQVIRVTVGGELATVDGRELTQLVLLTHGFGLRLAICGAANGYLVLQFTSGEGMWIGKVRSVAKLAADFASQHPEVQP